VDETTRQLWRRYKRDGDERARNELVTAHLPLVRYVLGRLPVSLPPSLSQEDLASVGVLALMGAIEDFDPERGVEFATFAVPRIRGAMFDELRKHDVVPRSVRQRAAAVEAACRELTERDGKPPSIAEIARYLGTSPRDVQRTMSAMGIRNMLSLEAAYRTPYGGREQIIEWAVDVASQTPLTAAMEREREAILARAIESLPEPDRKVITLYYRHGLMLKEIAQLLSVTKARVSQIHSRALFRLRAYLATLGRRPSGGEAVS